MPYDRRVGRVERIDVDQWKIPQDIAERCMAHDAPSPREATISALVGNSRGTVTSRSIHSVNTALVMAADNIAGYIQGLLDGVALKHTAYALDRESRKTSLAHFLGRTKATPENDGRP